MESSFDNPLKNFWQWAEKFSLYTRTKLQVLFPPIKGYSKNPNIFWISKIQKKNVKIPSWNIRVRPSKKLLQQNLAANGLPLVAGCLVIMVLYFVVNFCFHLIKQVYFVNFWYLQFPSQSLSDPKSLILRKLPMFLTERIPIFFHLKSIVKNMIPNVSSITFYFPSNCSSGHFEWMFGNPSDEICQSVQYFLLVFRNG